jgi:alkanesulfonate monooxygenase SsuD/methylene tetrahydromethanopterin reductase-like flavin-dependent oxidoreductase (luciferase family)
MNPTGITNGVAMMARGAREQIQYAQAVERLGYDTIWVSEVNGYDAVSVLTAVAGATSRVTIASGIVGIYLRDPLLMAMGAAAVNEFADGRLVLGLGTSTPVIVEQWHYGAFGGFAVPLTMDGSVAYFCAGRGGNSVLHPRAA